MGVAKSLRNLDDEQLRALAKNGGVVQLVALGSYVKALTPAQEKYKMDVRVKLGIENDKQFLSMGRCLTRKIKRKIRSCP